MTDTQEFKAFLDAHTGIVYKVCRIYSNDDEDFNDLVQEVTLQLWRSYNSFRGESKRSTWVYRVALNVCLLQIRQKQRKPYFQPLETAHVKSSSYLHEPEEDLEHKINALYEAIRQLKETDRALMLLYLEEKSYKEISEILGLSMSNVGVKINRVKNQLKQLLDGRI